ncbi:MAG: helix-turn-helix domain-containing protein [Promethearchaeota archaeon]
MEPRKKMKKIGVNNNQVRSRFDKFLPVFKTLLGEGYFLVDQDFRDKCTFIFHANYFGAHYSLGLVFLSWPKNNPSEFGQTVFKKFNQVRESQLYGEGLLVKILVLITASSRTSEEGEILVRKISKNTGLNIDLLFILNPVAKSSHLDPIFITMNGEEFWQDIRVKHMQLSLQVFSSPLPTKSQPYSERAVAHEVLVRDLLEAKQEGQKIEYKSRLLLETPRSKKELAKDIAAFANSSGGFIVVGVEDETWHPIGIKKGDWDIDKIQQIVTSRINPPVPIQIRLISLDNRYFGLIRVSPTRRVHKVDEKYPIRRGSIVGYMACGEIKDLEKERGII